MQIEKAKILNKRRVCRIVLARASRRVGVGIVGGHA